mmetsp:Transcript_23315/g.56539  ORF Transcript_23315/g.56539 Transcript_23315/m.56539 type:complete len:196 (-) Transcript_23315:251-838(-)
MSKEGKEHSPSNLGGQGSKYPVRSHLKVSGATKLPRNKSPARRNPKADAKNVPKARSTLTHGRRAKPKQCRIVSSGVARLVKHEQWVFYTAKLKFFKGGKGIQTLKATLTPSRCGFAVVRISSDLKKKGIKKICNILFSWKGKSASPDAKELATKVFHEAVTKLQPNDGYIATAFEEKMNLSSEMIYREFLKTKK